MNKDEKTYQFDYFSDAYQKFEDDFYQFSKINTPLTFLTDDLLNYFANSLHLYFKLGQQHSKDGKEHYFFFKCYPVPENKNIIRLTYQEHRYSLD